MPTRLMAAARRGSRQAGKSDPIDALAVAHAALRELDLPVAQMDGPARQVRLLSDHRRDLVAERNKLVNRLRWHLHEVDPGLHIPPPGLRRYCSSTLADQLVEAEGRVARIARNHLVRCPEVTVQINSLERELRDLVRVLAPSLLAAPGCGVLGAAMILGETAGAARFRSRHAHARFSGTAPIPVWSGNTVRVGQPRGQRPKTDRLDAVWLAKVVERGMCRPSLVHRKPIRQLRDVTRYRRSLVREQTREKQRLEKTLEDAQIKLDSVISDLHGVSGRQMMQAMIDGQRDPKVLAEMAHGSMRRKIPQLREALTGHFDDHHAFICATMLRRIDALAADIANLDTRIEELIAPFAAVVEKLDEVTGSGVQSAQEIIAEIGVNITVFPTAAHLVSWAKFSPIDAQSAGRKKANSTGKGNPWLAATLGEVVAGLSRTSTFLGDRYRRLARRRGKKRAVVAVGNSVLTIVWHLLTDPDARYQDLGPGFHESRIRKQRRQRDLIRQLEQLTGQKVDLQPLPQPAIA